ncbi:Uncharacterised protein [Actinobacillus equuli]|nr:Uncharacterised protein [Actinobacillus equuli]
MEQDYFFGREDGHLDKSQTDYLEKKLIEAFQKTDLTLDNVTSGNTSFIEKQVRSRQIMLEYHSRNFR